jgi:hypothetical protein
MHASTNIISEKKRLEELLDKGRYATVVRNQHYYNEIMNVVDQASNHMENVTY